MLYSQGAIWHPGGVIILLLYNMAQGSRLRMSQNWKHTIPAARAARLRVGQDSLKSLITVPRQALAGPVVGPTREWWLSDSDDRAIMIIAIRIAPIMIWSLPGWLSMSHGSGDTAGVTVWLKLTQARTRDSKAFKVEFDRDTEYYSVRVVSCQPGSDWQQIIIIRVSR